MSIFFKFLYWFSIIVVLYILSIFLFPSFTENVWNKIWLIWFNNYIISLKDKVNNFVFGISDSSLIQEKTKEIFEIKQSVESKVDETKQKIETIQNAVEDTSKSIQETSDSINKTVDSLNNLKNSITNTGANKNN